MKKSAVQHGNERQKYILLLRLLAKERNNMSDSECEREGGRAWTNILGLCYFWIQLLYTHSAIIAASESNFEVLLLRKPAVESRDSMGVSTHSFGTNEHSYMPKRGAQKSTQLLAYWPENYIVAQFQ